METFADEIGGRHSTLASRHRRKDRVPIAGDGLAGEDSIPSVSVGSQILKARLRAELSIQARIRLPITYAALAARMVVPVSMSAISDALERLMDDDADDALPFLAAIAVRTGGPRPAGSLVLQEGREHRAVHGQCG